MDSSPRNVGLCACVLESRAPGEGTVLTFAGSARWDLTLFSASFLHRLPRGHPSSRVQHLGNQDAGLQLCCPGGGYKLGFRCLLDLPQ